MKLQHLHTLVGLLLIGLFTQNGLADISLTLRNGGRSGGQPYLPPRAQQNAPPRNVEYVNVREGGSSQQQNFEESNYANSRYQIFEVHNHYEPAVGSVAQSQGNDASRSNFEAQGYLPPHQEIHIQHVNAAQDANDDNLDVSYLSLAAAEDLNGQQITIAEHAPSAPAPKTPLVSIPFPSNYQHDFQKNTREPAITTHEIHVEHHEVPQQTKVNTQDVRQSNYRASDYLPPNESIHITQTPAAPEYRAPDYLPPHRDEHVNQQQQQQQQQQQHHQHQQQHQVTGVVHQQQQQHQVSDVVHQQQQQQVTGVVHQQQQHHVVSAVHQQQQHHVASAVHQQQQHQVTGAVHQLQPGSASANFGQARYKGPDYLPPVKTTTQETVILREQNFETQNRQVHPTSAPVKEHELRSEEYIPPHTDQQQQQNVEVQQPTYQQHQEVRTLQQQNQQVQQVAQTTYKGPDYLPPHKEVINQQQQYQQQHQQRQQQQQQIPTQTNYKGPDYLPPHTSVVQPQQYHHQEQQPNYNEATQDNVATVQNEYKGPDYLPPHNYGVASHENHHNEQHAETIAPAGPSGPVSEYRAPGYLPPGYDFVNPEEKQPEISVHNEQQQHAYQPQQRPLTAQHVSVAQHPSVAPAAVSTYRAPGFLPSGYEINKPEGAEQAIAQLHSQEQQQPRHVQQPQSVQQYQQQTHVQTTTAQQQQHQDVVVQTQIQVAGREQASDIIYGRPKQQQQPQHPQPQQHQQIAEVQHSSFQGNGYLPPQNVAHATPVVQQQPQQQNYQVQHGHVQTSTSSVQQQHQQQHVQQSQHYHQQQHHQPKLPLQQSQQQQQPPPQQQQQQNYRQQVTPQFFPIEEPRQQFVAPVARPVALGVAPPPAYMHTLSSYMTTVQPFERYGDAQFTEPRRPFAEYGPPRPRAASTAFHPSQPLPQQQLQPQQSFEVAPMYREQATRPQYYAPSMSYRSYGASTTSTSLLSAQAKQSLQKFMPREIQQQIAAAAVAAPTTSGKIRTVQIVNPTAVKTLKVLETSDHAGVKTIKILGTTNEDPMGEHRIVKVVSQNAHNGQENHVQTVKIFNDHKDVVIPAVTPVAAPVTGNSNRNAYLPPAPRKQRSARVSTQQQKRKQRPIAAGKGRRRY